MRYAFLIPILGLLASLGATPGLAAEGRPAGGALGIWMNPKHSLVVHTDACANATGATLCGRIVWASRQALADASDASVPRLVGTELLEDYRLRGKGVWQGTVFVPDMGRRFYSEIDEVSPDRLKVKGCILGGLLCKSQVWTRVAQVPA
ncbi:DUF2147 domain-containing protein [Novosphingobium sp. BL-52-GroH]|uniref:DUF2147 domain-containing protein n=1 Tax=Novosphingobium sp. BL-52-GroH TaxID=3349877 RepID=UPI00384E2E1D